MSELATRFHELCSGGFRALRFLNIGGGLAAASAWGEKGSEEEEGEPRESLLVACVCGCPRDSLLRLSLTSRGIHNPTRVYPRCCTLSGCYSL